MLRHTGRKEREHKMKKTPEIKELENCEMPKNQFIVSWSHSTGVVVDETFEGYPVYRIRLAKVDEIFENTKQSWDKDYDAAQQVFG